MTTRNLWNRPGVKWMRDPETIKREREEENYWRKVTADEYGIDPADPHYHGEFVTSRIAHSKQHQKISLDDFLFELEIVRVPARAGRQDKSAWGATASHYLVKISVENQDKENFRYEPQILTVFYSQGSGIKTWPRAASILESLLGDATYGQYSFRDYCNEMGEDPDSLRAYGGWQACQEVYEWLSDAGARPDQLAMWLENYFGTA